MKKLKVLYKPDFIARRVRQLGKQISRDFAGETLDVVTVLDNGFVFAADLLRALRVPVRTHFVRAEAQDIIDPNLGKERKEIFYTPDLPPDVGKNILLVEGVMHSGVTTDFLLRRIDLRHPRVLKTAVVADKPQGRKVSLEPDYYAFRLASNTIVVGYGLSWDGRHGHLPCLATCTDRANRRPASAERSRGRRSPGKKK